MEHVPSEHNFILAYTYSLNEIFLTLRILILTMKIDPESLKKSYAVMNR